MSVKTATFKIVKRTSLPELTRGAKNSPVTLAIRNTLTTPDTAVQIPINGEPPRLVHLRYSARVAQLAKQLNAKGHARRHGDAVYVWLEPRKSEEP